jgi:hypothetical protein
LLFPEAPSIYRTAGGSGGGTFLLFGYPFYKDRTPRGRGANLSFQEEAPFLLHARQCALAWAFFWLSSFLEQWQVHYASCRTLEQQGREDDEGKG